MVTPWRFFALFTLGDEGGLVIGQGAQAGFGLRLIPQIVLGFFFFVAVDFDLVGGLGVFDCTHGFTVTLLIVLAFLLLHLLHPRRIHFRGRRHLEAHCHYVDIIQLEKSRSITMATR